MSDTVTASVSEPTKVPKRPALYLTIFRDDRGYWMVDSLHGIKDYADMSHTTRAGSVLVTIPGECDDSPPDAREEAAERLAEAAIGVKSMIEEVMAWADATHRTKGRAFLDALSAYEAAKEARDGK